MGGPLIAIQLAIQLGRKRQTIFLHAVPLKERSTTSAMINPKHALKQMATDIIPEGIPNPR